MRFHPSPSLATTLTHRLPMPEWNSTPWRASPPALRGLKTTREPWAKDEKTYNEGLAGHGARPNKPSMSAPKQVSPEKAEAAYRTEYNNWLRRTNWNPTPFRNAPDPIKGLKPVTREPWYASTSERANHRTFLISLTRTYNPLSLPTHTHSIDQYVPSINPRGTACPLPSVCVLSTECH